VPCRGSLYSGSSEKSHGYYSGHRIWRAYKIGACLDNGNGGSNLSLGMNSSLIHVEGP
jgi:hypothetical protein